MKLINRQVELLEIERENIRLEISKLNNYKNRDTLEEFCPGNRDIGEEILKCEYRINTIYNLLNNAEIVESDNSNIVGVGSKLSVLFNYGDDDMQFTEFTIIDEKVTTECMHDDGNGNEYFISAKSLMGKALLNRENGSQFVVDINGLNVAIDIVCVDNKNVCVGKSPMKKEI